MDSQTKGEIVESVSSLIGSLGKELFVRRREREMMERQAELDKEVALARAGEVRTETVETNERGRGNQQVVNKLSEAANMAAEYDDLLSSAENAEECDVCRRLIKAARERPLREQRRMLPDLRDFLASVSDDTPREELVSELRDSEALMGLLEEEFAPQQRDRDRGSFGPPAGDSEAGGSAQSRLPSGGRTSVSTRRDR